MKGPKDSLLRARREGEETRVGFVELFFDLVFVFAITSSRISCSSISRCWAPSRPRCC